MNPSHASSTLSDVPAAVRYIRFAGIALFVVLVVGYLAHIRSPLRLNTDAVTILTSAANYAEGKGLLIDGKPPVYPPLVLVAIAGADRLGLARPPLIAASYLFFVAVFLVAWYGIFRKLLGAGDKWVGFWAVVTSLLCGALIKHAIIPLTDLPYCAISAFTLYILLLAEDEGSSVRARVALVCTAVVLTLISIGVRTVGITLLPALGIVVLKLAPRGLFTMRTTVVAKAAIVIGAFALVSLVVFFVSRTQYFHDLLQRYSGKGDGVSIFFTLRQRAIELGQLVTNLPASRIPARLNLMVIAVGLISIGVYAAGRWSLSRHRGWIAGDSARPQLYSFDGTLVSYAAIMAVWPYAADTRFWLPVLPLLAFYAILGGRAIVARWSVLKLPVGAWALAYSGLGLIALVTSLKFSTSRAQFVNGYGAPEVRSAYRAAWHLPDDAPPERYLPNWIETIRHYDP